MSNVIPASDPRVVKALTDNARDISKLIDQICDMVNDMAGSVTVWDEALTDDENMDVVEAVEREIFSMLSA